MAKGHAMRNRAGESSNMYEASNTPTRSFATHHEAVESAASAGSPRLPIGVAQPERGTLIPRKNTQSADPTAGGKANRVNVMQERLGARYAIDVSTPAPHMHENGPTQADGQIVPSATKR
jgi:hypothetical protein